MEIEKRGVNFQCDIRKICTSTVVFVIATINWKHGIFVTSVMLLHVCDETVLIIHGGFTAGSFLKLRYETRSSNGQVTVDSCLLMVTMELIINFITFLYIIYIIVSSEACFSKFQYETHTIHVYVM